MSIFDSERVPGERSPIVVERGPGERSPIVIEVKKQESVERVHKSKWK